jgi:hypothetical protein
MQGRGAGLPPLIRRPERPFVYQARQILAPDTLLLVTERHDTLEEGALLDGAERESERLEVVC